MQLTSENYYSQEANKEYMSVSGYKDFAGTYGKMPCEFYGMEKLNGRWEDEKSTALLVGSYVDSYFEGSLDQFKKDNPEIFTQKGELKANFKQAEEMKAEKEALAGENTETPELPEPKEPVLPAERNENEERPDRFMITDGFHDRPVNERNAGKYKGYVKIEKSECDLKKIIGRIRGARPWHPLLKLLQKEAG